MSTKTIMCDKCGFVISAAEYAKNEGICFDCVLERDNGEEADLKPEEELNFDD